ncbi:MAG: cysteine-rich CWC family protein [Comamonadaceae bacterium]|nr:cysteine-rich CWC family protein [Comamonadaceae bacterium]
MFSLPNPLRCPLCGQDNQCAVAAGLPAESCWCMQTRIAPQALERLPEAQRAKACICPACGQAPVTNKQPG